MINEIKPTDLKSILSEIETGYEYDIDTIHSHMIENSKLFLERLENAEPLDLINGSSKQKKIIEFLDYFAEWAKILKEYM